MENWPWLWAESQPRQIISLSKKRHLHSYLLLPLVSVISLPKISWDPTSLTIFVSHREPRCWTSAEEYKRLCALLSLHASSNSQTWLPGILGLLEGSEPKTKPLAPPSCWAHSILLQRSQRGSLLPAAEGVPRPPFTTLTSDTEQPFAAHWEKTHNTPPGPIHNASPPLSSPAMPC